MARPVKQHLQNYHTESAEHAAKCAACFGKLAGMAKADGGQAEQFQTLADLHSSHAAMHCAMADACEKAVQADLDKLTPTDARVTIPTDTPASARSTYKAVPRMGQPLIDTKDVPSELSDLLKIEG